MNGSNNNDTSMQPMLEALDRVAASMARMETHLAAIVDHDVPGRIPYIDSIVCTAANVAYPVNVGKNIGRAATRGFIKLDSDAGGDASFRMRATEQSGWSNWYTEIVPGESVEFTGQMVYDVEVKSTYAGDIVLIFAGA